jgi:RNA recognition motif-containing protein
LPWRATEDEVREYFASCGKITSLELPLQDDGRSSGTGRSSYCISKHLNFSLCAQKE